MPFATEWMPKTKWMSIEYGLNCDAVMDWSELIHYCLSYHINWAM